MKPVWGVSWLLDRQRLADWKRTYALVVVYGFTYNMMLWGPLDWAVRLYAYFHEYKEFPLPNMIPWPILAAASANMAVVGAVQFARDRQDDSRRSKRHAVSTTTETVETTAKAEEPKPPMPGLA